MKPRNKYINRELSWLQFNDRVLQEAMDPTVPIIERLRFLGIFSNNRDEFFRVRVATVKRMIQVKMGSGEKLDFDPAKVLMDILEIVEEQEKKFNATYKELIDELRSEQIFFVDEKELTQDQAKFVHQYFEEKVRPLLFPIILKNLRNPDTLHDNSIYLALLLHDSQGKNEDEYALTRIPSDRISRFLLVPCKNNNKQKYICCLMMLSVIRWVIFLSLLVTILIVLTLLN